MGGGQASPAQYHNYTQLYDGSSWTSLNNMNTARRLWSNGTSRSSPTSAGVTFGGNAPPTTSATELWDGTNWTSNPTGLNVARVRHGGAGTQTAALAFGGWPGSPPSAVTGATEEYTSVDQTTIKTVTTT